MSKSKTAVSGKAKPVVSSTNSRKEKNPGEVRSAGQDPETEVFPRRSSELTSSQFAQDPQTGALTSQFSGWHPEELEAFDESSARISSAARAPSHSGTLDESSARMRSSAGALSHSPLPASPESTVLCIPTFSGARLLCCTLVADRALPSGYEAEFEGLMRTVEPAAERQAKACAQLKPEDTT